MANTQTSASTKFYMDQANKIVDVLSEIIPTIYCDVFKDDFDIFMNGLWDAPDDTHPPIIDKSILKIGETTQSLEKIKWKSLSKEKQMEWLKRLDLQALLKALRFRPESLKLFCEKNSLVESKMANVLQSMINWRNYGVGHKSVFKYEQMDEALFKLNILEPVWEFSDLLSRYYGRECETLRRTLQDVEKRMKLPEISIDSLVKSSKKSEDIIREVLSILRIYVDNDGNIKGEDEKELTKIIKKLGNKEAINKKKKEAKRLAREKERKTNNYKRIKIALVCSCVLLFALSVIILLNWNDKKTLKDEIVKYQNETKKIKGIDINNSSGVSYRIAPVSEEDAECFGKAVYNGSLTDREALCATVLAECEYYAKKGCAFRTPSLQKYFNKQKWYRNNGYGLSATNLTKEENKNIQDINDWRSYYRENLKGVTGKASDYTTEDYFEVARKVIALEEMVLIDVSRGLAKEAEEETIE